MRAVLRIAQVAPLYERVPPEKYGGTERVVSYLTERLVADGHDVTLYASGDSLTSARLRSTCPRSLRLSPGAPDPVMAHFLMLERVFREAADFDLVHFHVDYLSFPWLRRQPLPHLITLHGRLDLPELVPLYREFPDFSVVSISDAQRKPLPWLQWQGTVYHGLPPELLSQGSGDGRYLAFLGRVSPEKGLERAIEISRRVAMPLKVAAKIDKNDIAYHEEKIAPLLAVSPHVEWIGEIDEHEKQQFLGSAHALLFPIDWPEPFGMVMIESMACGTPVIAFEGGSVREVIDDGVTGYVVRSLEEAVTAVRRVRDLDRTLCRRIFDIRFSNGRMATDYLRLYDDLLRPALHKVIPRGRDYPTEGPVLRPGDLFAS